MRPYTKRYNPPMTMIGGALYKVLQSKNKDFPEGSQVMSMIGWVDVGILDPMAKSSAPGSEGTVMTRPAPSIGTLSPSLLLGALGMPGNTAYFGFLEICQPKAGETVVVNGAAGAVGSLVGQIAKIKGCHVIGFAGSDEKCQTLLNKYGFDKAYNYKKTSVQDALKDGAPNGVDCFFDNVGGEDAAVIINSMNEFGRVSCCGAISVYNESEKALPKISTTSQTIVFRQLTVQGFIVSRWKSRYPEAIKQMAQWIQEGKIKYDETIIEGFEKMPEAFIGLLTGTNLGKMIVKA